MISSPPFIKKAGEGKEIEEAVTSGKLLSYVPSEGWSYRSKEELNQALDGPVNPNQEDIYWPVFSNHINKEYETV